MADVIENEIPIDGLLSLDELNQSQVIMPEFTAPTFRPKVTLNYNDLAFNSSCVKLFPDNKYFQLLVDDQKKRVIALPCGQYEVDIQTYRLLSDQLTEE